MKNVQERYIFARASAQLQEATLEEIKTDKFVNEFISDYVVALEFSTKLLVINEDIIDGYLTVLTSLREEASKKNHLQISITYRGRFINKSKESDSVFQEWVEVQIVPQLLSYVRTVVWNISIQMGCKPITIPTMDILNSIEANESQSRGGDLNDVSGEN